MVMVNAKKLTNDELQARMEEIKAALQVRDENGLKDSNLEVEMILLNHST